MKESLRNWFHNIHIKGHLWLLHVHNFTIDHESLFFFSLTLIHIAENYIHMFKKREDCLKRINHYKNFQII